MKKILIVDATDTTFIKLLYRYHRITEITSYGDIASYLNISRRQLQRIKESLSSKF